MVRPPATPRPLAARAEPQNLVIDLARTAIVVIDMQNDFCSPQGWLAQVGVDVTPARTPIAPLAALLPWLRSEGVPVLWVNWGNRPDRMNLSPSLLHACDPTGEGPGLGHPLPGPAGPAAGAKVLERDSWPAAIVDGLQVAPTDIHVAKYRMSGFWDTELDSILRNLRITTLLFAGVNLDQCVMCTLQDANFLGYDCILVNDCCATTSPSYCLEATLYNVKQCFGFVTNSDHLLNGLKDRAT
ncbi:cysteine hydrolase [Skermanella rosea]|uniref:cysteine hydrolase family protein n=1 Tax=Skermanella rosea TaxID=1817965 RepID=UPI001E57A948|nr:isochorismatase family cysteine hydrolase [Skermanella rosea]UEM02222.1 cysteine hydrolase [Skermanella rosea]